LEAAESILGHRISLQSRHSKSSVQEWLYRSVNVACVMFHSHTSLMV
jgi:hypothetical protein